MIDLDDDDDDDGPARALYRRGDPDTSRESAERIVEKLNLLQINVLRFFASIHPRSATRLDCENRFENNLSTYRTRCAELRDRGCLEVVGKAFQNGSSRELLQITPFGFEVLHKFDEMVRKQQEEFFNKKKEQTDE